MDSSRSVGVRGREVVPNHFTIELSTEDYESFADVRTSLARELCDAAREHAEAEEYHFMGPVEVEFECSETLRTGSFEIVARLRQAERSATGALVMADGSHVLLDGERLLIGRLPDCRVQLSDTNVSRHHAEVRPKGAGHVVTDLGSTNGTYLNRRKVSAPMVVSRGDRVQIGSTVMEVT